MKTNKTMNRTELIYALAAKAHPQHFHQIALWNTETLRKLLAYYSQPETKDDKYIKLKFQTPALKTMNIDMDVSTREVGQLSPEGYFENGIADRMSVELILNK